MNNIRENIQHLEKLDNDINQLETFIDLLEYQGTHYKRFSDRLPFIKKKTNYYFAGRFNDFKERIIEVEIPESINIEIEVLARNILGELKEKAKKLRITYE